MAQLIRLLREYYSMHFVEEETEAWRVTCLAQVNRADGWKIQIQVRLKWHCTSSWAFTVKFVTKCFLEREGAGLLAPFSGFSGGLFYAPKLWSLQMSPESHKVQLRPLFTSEKSVSSQANSSVSEHTQQRSCGEKCVLSARPLSTLTLTLTHCTCIFTKKKYHF